MNISSVLLKQVIANSDIDTWGDCLQHYFPSEYHSIYSAITRYVTDYGRLPAFDDLQLSVRDPALRDKFSAIETVDLIEIEPDILLEYLKNEYTQVEIMSQLEKYLENSIAMEAAKENIDSLQNIVLDLETKIDLRDPEENMQKMQLFDSTADMERSISLGLNSEYDSFTKFSPTDMVLIGGRRGAGKSFTCSNIASNTFDDGDSVIYFTIEMTARQIMQRCCSVSTGVPINALRNRNLSIGEWQLVAEWWSNRFEDGEHAFREYLEHRDFDKYHSELTVRPLREKQLDVVYNPTLTLGNIRTELDKKVSQIKPKVVIVDYVNQVKRAAVSNSRMGQYDWTEQIEVSKSLKAMAQDYNVVMVSPYQTDATGEARFAKGILDSADTAFSLDPHMKEDNIITFNCVKMRNGEETDFTSTMDWTTLRIGPETGKVQTEEESNDEDPYDI